MKIKIEKDVPMKVRHDRIYPLHLMEVGDSFLLPEGAIPASIYSSARYIADRQETGNFRVSVRMTDQGYRCWRTE